MLILVVLLVLLVLCMVGLCIASELDVKTTLITVLFFVLGLSCAAGVPHLLDLLDKLYWLMNVQIFDIRVFGATVLFLSCFAVIGYVEVWADNLYELMEKIEEKLDEFLEKKNDKDE